MTISIKSLGGVLQEPPVISDLQVVGEPTQDSIQISYKVTDAELQIVRHYITVKTSTNTIYNKKEITKDVHYESPNNIFNYTITGLEKNTTYTIQIEVFDGLDGAKSDALSISTRNAIIHGVRVMTNNSNPQTAITYIEDSVGISPATKTSLGGWANEWPFNKVKIVGFKNGRETGDIDPNDKKKYKSGSSVPLDVDVMTAIPKFYWKVTNIMNGYELRISDTKLDGFDCYAHKVNGVEKDYIYEGCYLGSSDNGALRSRSGVVPKHDDTYVVFQNLAKRRGNGYHLSSFFLRQAELILFVLNYKSFYSQKVLGFGVCNSFNPVTTGGNDKKGLNWGSTNKEQQVSFLGIEDFYGNFYQMLDGALITPDKEFKISLTNSNFNATGMGYQSIYTYQEPSIRGYITDILHKNEGVFVPTKINGSYTTYYTDLFDLNIDSGSGGYPIFVGGYHNENPEDSGAFATRVNMKINQYDLQSTGRLCYLG